MRRMELWGIIKHSELCFKKSRKRLNTENTEITEKSREKDRIFMDSGGAKRHERLSRKR